tara:strand:+ start:1620 stop:2633 length:1014 start_codon:yes stop_codon:yes gene_type:complete
MNYKYLGVSSLKVSSLCLGTMTFGDSTSEKEADRIVTNAWENGVNFIDTADVYSHGESERLVGKFIASARDWWVLATKVGNPMGKSVNEAGLSRKWVTKACEDSLRRLNTDYIDIYYLHRDYENTALEEIISVMGKLMDSGKIRYFGLSNFRGWRIAEIVRICDNLKISRPVVCQPYYNAVNRMPEVEIIPVCKNYGIGIVPYSPIARGVLTGKYKKGATPSKDTRAGRKDERLMETEFRDESFLIGEKIIKYLNGKGISSGQFATSWVLSNEAVDSVIAGPRTFEQWSEYYPALEYVLTHQDEKFVDSLVAPGHPSTPGFNDPKYPVRGRFTKHDV